MRILISSYSFGAGRGSEAGVGWNVAYGLASRGHEVHVLTTTEYASLNHPALKAEGCPPITLHEWDCGVRDFPPASSYRHWQKAVGEPLRKLCAEVKFDLIHHLTFNQYRSVHEVFEAGIPYIAGPLGGAETMAAQFRKELPLKARVKELLRHLKWDALLLKRRYYNCPQRGIFLASGPQTQRRLEGVAGISEVYLEPIIAIDEAELCDSASRAPMPYFIAAAGGMRPDKAPWLTIRALAKLWEMGQRIPLKMAAVPEVHHAELDAYRKAQGLPAEALEILPFMPREQLLALMQGSIAFLCFNFRDSGCMALLEAVALGIPSICFDNEEQFWLPCEYARKVNPKSKQVEKDLAQSMLEAYTSPEPDAQWHAARLAWLREKMTWAARVDRLEHYYKLLLES